MHQQQHCAIHGDIHTSCARAGCSGAVPENEKQEFKLSGESLSGFGDQVLCPKLVRSAVSVSLSVFIYIRHAQSAYDNVGPEVKVSAAAKLCECYFTRICI